jgi:hypothetical protein
MKKAKLTRKSALKETQKLHEGLQKYFEEYRAKVRAYVLAVGSNPSNSSKRRLMSITPANDEGLINGLTIPELVMLVNLTEGTGEQIILETENNKKDLLVVAKKTVPTPWGLL